MQFETVLTKTFWNAFTVRSINKKVLFTKTKANFCAQRIHTTYIYQQLSLSIHSFLVFSCFLSVQRSAPILHYYQQTHYITSHRIAVVPPWNNSLIMSQPITMLFIFSSLHVCIRFFILEDLGGRDNWWSVYFRSL